VQIQSEEQSGLEEKSARDGLRDNKAYERLKEITLGVIAELEVKRFDYRRKAGLSRTTVKIEQQLEKLFVFDELKQGIRKKLLSNGIAQQTANEIIDIISRKEEENNKIAEDLRQTVAIYQGQATLGKIINAILHEGRRPLNYFKNQIPTLNFWIQELKKSYNLETLDEVLQLSEGIGNNAKAFVSLFSRLDPLSAVKRGPRKEFNFFEVLNNSFQVFESELIDNKISHRVNARKDLSFKGWQQDIYVVMTNLIDNSIYWMIEKRSPQKHIEISVFDDGAQITHIDYKDSGPGIETHLIESGVIFEPEFTTKRNGTGLGLAIAGEAAARNGFELTAFGSNTGAYFRLQSKDRISHED
jgi:signal transduction histidine kinase